MALDYDKRIDFRAFDVLADAIQHATPAELKGAIDSCSEIAASATYNASTRLLFRCFTNMMRLYLRKFNKPAKKAPVQARGL